MSDAPHRYEKIEQNLREAIAAILKETGEQQKDLTKLLGHRSLTMVSRRQRGTTSWEISEVGLLATHWQMPVGALFEGRNAALQALPPERAAQLRHSKEAPVLQAA
ncbi:XRE family transcriptional regulator [Streptomyces albus]|uniref:XRE family transcriptional regulator n=1 Tax=Streptomyces albus TaxID=1888 RepID=UPI00340A7FBB